MESAETDFYLRFWEEAALRPIGVAIATDDVEDTRQRLYIARKASGNPAFDAIGAILSPDRKEVWLMKDAR